VAIASGNGGNGRRIWVYAVVLIGTVLVSVATAFLSFGQQQQDSIIRLEQSEQEDARQRQVDQTTVRSLLDAIEAAQIRLRTNEQAIAVLQSKVAALEDQVVRLQEGGTSP
jgi:uncharacterized protein HemX